MVLATVWNVDGSRGRDREDWPSFGAELILRGLLRRPSTIASVRRRAEALLAAAAPARPAPRARPARQKAAR